MKLSEARKRYIGKQFRIKRAERGYYRPYIIRDQVGTCTSIEAMTFGVPLNDTDGLPEAMTKPRTVFRFRIEIPGHVKWFAALEIEPVEKN